MMRFFILALLLGVMSHGMAQVLMRTYYDQADSKIKEEFYVLSRKNPLLNGPYTSYYESGEIKSEGKFIQNRSSGIWKYYYQNGKVKMTGRVSNGKNVGVWSYYYPSGNLKMSGEIRNGEREGPWVIYDANGTKQSEGSFDHEKKVSDWQYYYSSGVLRADEFFDGDSAQYEEYYISGNIKMNGSKYKNKKAGHWRFYNEDGSLQAEGSYQGGKKTGPWKHYTSEGLLEAEGSYKNDEPNGLWLHYYINGQLASKGNLAEGKKDGPWKMYYNDGTLKGEGLYENGTGTYREYYKNGSLKLRGEIRRGTNEGKWEYFYENGDLEGDCVFHNGQGNYVGYYPTREVKMKGEIKDNIKIGIWELYEKNGQLAGYYKPYYEEGEPAFFLAEDIARQKALSATRRARPGSFKYKKKSNRYFHKNINEYQTLIVGYNPVAPLFDRFPISFEYYMEERLGYELLVQYIRSPFFKSFETVSGGNTFSDGGSVSIRQKFYHSETKLGLPYFGHELRYAYERHFTNLQGVKTKGATESRYEYALLVGMRYFKNRNDRGFTLDTFIGFGLGYRDYNQTYVPPDPTTDPFAEITSRPFSYSMRVGVNLGFAFKAQK